jgi:V/A-type H+/Na+-transporting ATPase subunit G/H
LISDILAKGKAAHTDIPPPTSHSAVETIVSALSELENDIDGMYGRVEEMKRRIIAHSDEEIEKLRQQIITLANEEAKQIVDITKAEAEAESEKIGEIGRANLANIRKNIKASFDTTVDNIVQAVLGDTSAVPVTPQKLEKESQPSSSSSVNPPAKIRKYTSDGKPLS